MNLTPQSARERRLVALLILLAAIALAWLLLVAPVLAGFAERAQRREALALQYAHNLRTIGAIPRLRRQAERQRAATRGYVLDAADVEAGRELVKARLQDAVEANGGEYREGSDAEGRPGWARASAAARLSLPQLVAVLTRVRGDAPYLVTEALTVSADEAVVTGRATTLEVTIDASAPLRAPAAR